MGLDMYALMTINTPTPAVDFADPGECEQLHYWRKHPDLHGWMQALYLRKGGKHSDFNMAPVRIEAADLVALENAIRTGSLPSTSGFFFGVSDCHDRLEDDLAFIAKANAAIRNGYSVFYYAWW